ncbi:hypothetical protein RUMCAL_02336, partial [Ruminococcus callidus ATCC 27760]
RQTLFVRYCPIMLRCVRLQRHTVRGVPIYDDVGTSRNLPRHRRSIHSGTSYFMPLRFILKLP